jgi:hypothetical protein
MKYKLIAYLVLGMVLVIGGVQSMSAFGQMGPNRSSSNIFEPGFSRPPTNGGPAINYNPYPNQPQYPQQVPQVVPGISMPNPNAASVRPQQALVINKDGSVERIEKEQGTPFSQDEMVAISESRQKLHEALAKLRSPDSSDAARKEAKELYAKYLKAEFKSDQETRRAQVDRLEKQVEQLRKQLVKRDEAQDKMIELRLQLIENDASGLSFPESWSNPMSGYDVNYGPIVTAPNALQINQDATTRYGLPGAGPGMYVPNQMYPMQPTNPPQNNVPKGKTNIPTY